MPCRSVLSSLRSQERDIIISIFYTEKARLRESRRFGQDYGAGIWNWSNPVSLPAEPVLSASSVVLPFGKIQTPGAWHPVKLLCKGCSPSARHPDAQGVRPGPSPRAPYAGHEAELCAQSASLTRCPAFHLVTCPFPLHLPWSFCCQGNWHWLVGSGKPFETCKLRTVQTTRGL